MVSRNPYHPPTNYPSAVHGCRIPSNRSLWRAYLLAPAVAPIAFMSAIFLVNIFAGRLGVQSEESGLANETGFIKVPILLFTIGFVGCYFVAVVIGMPVAFCLRRWNALNGYSINGAALCSALLLSVTCAVTMVGKNWNSLPVVLCYLASGVVPPILLSASAFWLLVRRFSRLEANRPLSPPN